MKKIIIVLCFFLCLTGCEKQNQTKYDFTTLGPQLEEYFPNTKEYTKEELGLKYDIDITNVENAYIRMSLLPNQADMIFLIEPRSGKKEEVKQEFDTLLEAFLTQYEMYYVEEYQKLEDRKYMEKDPYIIYIVSEHQDSIIQLLERESK